MSLFWILATLMTVVALAFVLVPLLLRRAAAGPSLADANLDVLRGQRQEIEADVARGVLPADARAEALAELVARAEQDLAPEAAQVAPATRRSWAAAAIVAIAVPAVAFGVYLAVGNPAASDARHVAHAKAPDDARIVEMVESLAKKVQERPDDARGWSLLARSMAALGRFDESAKAYEHLAKLQPQDAQVLADYADALGMAQGRSLRGKPYELAKAALAIDPQHRKSLALAGTAAMDAGDLAGAAAYWQRLAAVVEPGSEDDRQVRAILDEVKKRAASAGKSVPEPKLASAPKRTTGKVAGSVTIAPEIAAKVSPSDTLYVFARAEGGGRAPLAVWRTTAGNLPAKFSLDDTMAMSPQARLSEAQAVRIEARITRTGNAMPQAGDLVGRSDVVKPGDDNVKVVVNQVVP